MSKKVTTEKAPVTFTITEKDIQALHHISRGIEMFPLQAKLTQLFGEKVANEQIGAMINLFKRLPQI